MVEAIEEQIASGKLGPDDKVPSAKAISDTFGIANMTAQRALRELQNRNITYGVAGRGSFVRPEAVTRLAGTARVITNDAEYQALMGEFKKGADRIQATLQDALASDDISRIVEAKAVVEHYWNVHANQLRELLHYARRVEQAGRKIEDVISDS
ncbi:DNA-binding GntR family transcriptional regulator [Kitasatospora sp. MAA4]|uniref:GntR family transcriptional regulator n=1 Tax=Kitasatospora sp. MAA4 TaxID=3035093 RepID=UPI00247338E8|nr:winged helix-turn-helix domain-containing protein [Kitasatospora sp. MAA4]MDH6134921.1 DNA-binding GntR family transcriptional regulator [Kitasatospora sp. MAA4]